MSKRVFVAIVLAGLPLGCGSSAPPPQQATEELRKMDEQIIADPAGGPGSKAADTSGS